MIVRSVGRADYTATWIAMREFTRKRDSNTEDELWLVEHPPVFTLGQAGRREHLRGATGIPIVHSDRGGQVTYHGPGQVVAYTLVDLRRLGVFVKEMVFRIEQAVIQTLDGFGVDGRRVAGAPGVFVPIMATAAQTQASDPFLGFAKVAALGIKVSRGSSYHGVALNVAMDLAPFAAIDPCGYAGLRAIDLQSLGVAATWDQAAERLSERLKAHLSP